MSTAARNGILIKGGRYVEIAGQVDVVVVDKTGTLTDRLAEVTHITLFDCRYREDTVIRLAASAQQAWAHPLSRALVEKAKEHQLTLLPVTDSELVVGQGVRARIWADALVLGYAGFLEANDIQLASSSLEVCLSERQQMLVALNGRMIAALGMLHRQRPGTAGWAWIQSLSRPLIRCSPLKYLKIRQPGSALGSVSTRRMWWLWSVMGLMIHPHSRPPISAWPLAKGG